MTIYLPGHFACDDRQKLFGLMRDHSFATLISVPGVPLPQTQVSNPAPEPQITHLPVIVDEPSYSLFAHVARANPIWQGFSPDREVQIVFQGPHCYISPSWYAVHPSVPTWNYAVVHARGFPRILEDRSVIEAMLRRLVDEFESHLAKPWKMELPDRYLQSMIDGIVAFEIRISDLQGKFKLSQNRPESDRKNVIAALRQTGERDSSSVADWMEMLLDR